MTSGLEGPLGRELNVICGHVNFLFVLTIKLNSERCRRVKISYPQLYVTPPHPQQRLHSYTVLWGGELYKAGVTNR
jgi:hypothetical protein